MKLPVSLQRENPSTKLTKKLFQYTQLAGQRHFNGSFLSEPLETALQYENCNAALSF